MTYLPGQADVPCAVCGTVFNRRGAGGQGHRKWCSPDCRKEGKRLWGRERMGHSPRRADGVCPRCNTNPRVARPDGRLRGWCGPCEAAQKAEYMKSPAGLETLRRFREKHYTATDPEGRCPWCTRIFSRRGAHGAGNRKYCNQNCRTAYRKHLKATGKKA